jgi:hypothetical protein
MCERSFSALKSNPCVYCRIDDGFSTYVELHVDDFLILAKGNALVTQIKGELATQFKMTDLGPVKQIVGFEVIHNHNQRTLMLQQLAYIRKALDHYGMTHCNPLSMPMLPGQVLLKTEGPYPDMKDVPYREAIGSLIYAAVGTQPDIACATNTLSQFNVNPSHDHWAAVKRVLQYLKSMQDWKIVYWVLGTENAALAAAAFSDADWGTNPENWKSISGYAFYLASGAMSWSF